MQFKLQLSEQAKLKINQLKNENSKKSLLKQLNKTLGLMETDLKHPSLNTHKFSGMICELGDVFESYVQNNTPRAYRVFWAYGPARGEIYVLDILPHS